MKSLAQTLAKGSALRLLLLIANIFVGLFMMPFLIHSLGDEQYGLWIVIATIIGFYGLLDLGISNAAQRFIVHSIYDEKPGVTNIEISTAVILFFGIGLFSLLITAAVVIFGPLLITNNASISLYQYTAAILGINIAISFPLYVFHSVITAKYRFDIASYIQLFVLAVRSGLIIYFVSKNYGIIILAVITLLCGTLSHGLSIYYANKLLPSIKVSLASFRMRKVREYFNYGKYVFISAVADKARFSSDDLVVASILGVGMVTHYTIAATLIIYFGGAMAGIFGVITPVLNKYYKLEQWDNLREIFISMTELTTLTSVLIGGLLITLGQPFIHLWVGESYQDSYGVLVILAITTIIARAQQPSVAILYAIAKHRYYAMITTGEAVANLTISIILANIIGIYGVAIGTALPAIATKLIYQPRYTCKQVDVSLQQYYKTVSKVASMGTMVLTLLFLFTKYYLISSYVELVVVTLVSTIIYLFVTLKFAISKNTKQYIKDALPGKYQFLLRIVM